MDPEFIQTKVELEVHKAVVSKRRKWEEVEKLDKLAEAETRTEQQSVVSVALGSYELWRPN